MELRDLLRVLRRGWPVVLLLVAIGVGLGVGATAWSKKVYTADTSIFVASAPTTDVSALAAGNTFVQDRVQSYITIANSPAVTQAVVKNLGLSLTPAELADDITADAPQNRVIINLHVKNGDPTQAARIANAVGDQFKTVVLATEQTDSSGKPVVKLTTTFPATVPTSPSSPKPVLNVLLGLIGGLVIGLGIIIVRDVLDNAIKGPAEFEALGLPVLGMVPMDRRVSKAAIAFRVDTHGARAEAFRALRTNLQFVDVDNPPHIIMITSALPGEGKTMTSINLAAALAEANYRVCLIDADLRRPSVARTLGLVENVGFTSVLIGDAEVEDVLQNAGRNLAVMASGPIPPNPSELLLTSHARTMITELAERVDYLIIDTPPLLPVADAAELSTLADATVVVLRAGKTTTDQAARAVGALAKVGQRPVGAILNMINSSRGASYSEYGYYYEPYRPETKRRAVKGGSVAAALEAGAATDEASGASEASGAAGSDAGAGFAAVPAGSDGPASPEVERDPLVVTASGAVIPDGPAVRSREDASEVTANLPAVRGADEDRIDTDPDTDAEAEDAPDGRRFGLLGAGRRGRR